MVHYDSAIASLSIALGTDASAFEDRRIPDGWKKKYLQAGYAARVSALSFNENKITMIVRPEGDHASVSFNPAVSGLPLSNEVRIEKGSRGSRISFKQDSTGTMIVRGTMGSLAVPRDLYFVVERPELFAAGALRAVADGELWAPRKVISGLVREWVNESSPRQLTGRESEILALIAGGYTNRQIAESLFITRETVRWHVRSIYAKLGASDRESAIRYAISTGKAVPHKPPARVLPSPSVGAARA